VVQAPFV